MFFISSNKESFQTYIQQYRVKQKTKKKEHMHKYVIKHNLNNSALCPQIEAGKGQTFKYKCDNWYLSRKRPAKTLWRASAVAQVRQSPP